MNGVLPAAGASLAWGFSDYAGGVASRSLRVAIVLSLSQLAGFLVLAPAVLVRGAPALTAAQAGYAALAGAIAVFSLGLMFKGMAVGQVSIIGPVSACGVVIPVIAGLLRGEQPHSAQLVGVVAAVAGVALVSFEAREPGAPRRLVAGLGLAIGSAIAVGSWFVVFDAAAAGDPYWASFTSRCTTATIIAIVALAQRTPSGLRAASPAVIALVVASGVGDAGAELLYALATSSGLMSLVSVIASLYPAVMVALAALFLRERLLPRQLVGVLAALAGIALISAG